LKKALVLAIVMVLGLGVLGFAQLTGSWDVSISIDPGATQAGDLFIDLSSSLAITYTAGCFDFGSTSTFDNIGWSGQSFTGDGTLGAFTFSTTMNFAPRTVTSAVWNFNNKTKTSLHENIRGLLATDDWYYTECWAEDEDYLTKDYSAAFDDWTVSGSVSIAGIDIEGLFFLEGYAGDATADDPVFYVNYASSAPSLETVQTSGDTAHVLATSASSLKTLGSGWKFTVGGSCGDMTINSYTYFNLVEKFSAVACGQSLTKSGTYTIDNPNCCMCFTEEYIHIDGFSFGCATFEMGLDITCAGFEWVSFKASGLDLGLCCSGITADFQVTFGTLTKRADLCFDFTVKETACFEFDISLDYSGTSITGVSIDGVTMEYAWNGLSFSSSTLFDGSLGKIYGPDEYLFFVPVTDMTNDSSVGISSITVDQEEVVSGYYDAVCYATEYYDLWESFTITSDGDACCGGAFSFSVEVSFGTKYELDYFAWLYTFDASLASGFDYYLMKRYFTPSPTTTAGYAALFDMTELEYLAWLNDHKFELLDAESTATYLEGLLISPDSAMYKKAGSDQLFEWAAIDVDASVGLGSVWTMNFGLDIDAYGWNGLDFGFEFAF